MERDPRDFLTSARCPRCDAEPGRPCRKPSGRPANRTHSGRILRAWGWPDKTATATEEKKRHVVAYTPYTVEVSVPRERVSELYEFAAQLWSE